MKSAIKNSLSIVLATYNEEKNLSGCLESIKDLADEIIVVDGTSSDATVEIAKKYGAKVKITTNKPNFHINKQMAIDMATGDWILQLDADERVSPDLAKEIRQVLEEKNHQSSIINHQSDVNADVNGFWIPRKNWFLGRFLTKGGQYPDYTLRLYRKGKGRLPQKDVHEQAVVEGKVEYLKNPLFHYPYKSFSHYLVKWNGYNNFFSKQIEEEQKKKNILLKIFYGVGYLFIKPLHWFLTTYIRHKGFMDGEQGFIFSLFSALRFPASYIKYLGFYRICVFFILLLSLLLRFYNYSNRWGLAYDQAHDAIVARYALIHHLIPFLGPFSSGGPFQTGGEWYWLIMIGTLFNPYSVITPWIFLTLLTVVNVLVIIYAGKELINRKFGLVAGILMAVSTAQITQSTNLTNQTPIALFSTLAIFSMIKYLKTKKIKYIFLEALFIGIASSIHLQGIALVPLIAFTLLFERRKFILAIFLSGFGLLVPWLPVFISDASNHFYNTSNMFNYLLNPKMQVSYDVLGRRWLTFAGIFIPNAWGFIIGGYAVVGYILIAGIGILIIKELLRREISKQWLIIIFSTLCMFAILLYTRTPLFKSFYVFMHPFVILLTSWLIYEIYRIKKYAGIVILLLVVSISIYRVSPDILNVSNSASSEASYFSQLVKLSFPRNTFTLYDYKFKTVAISYPTVLYLMRDNLLRNNGIKIGFASTTNSAQLKAYKASAIAKKLSNNDILLDLNGYNNKQLHAMGWVFINPSKIYRSTEDWWH